MALTKTKPKPAATDGEEAAVTGGGKKKKLLIALPLLVAMVAGWFFLLGPGSGGAAEKPKKPEPGAVLQLQPITMNLADGRLLKLGLALQLPLEPAAGGHGEVSGSMALDEAIAYLGEQTYEQLAAPGARQAAKKELSHRVEKRYHHEVLEVYFTEFVMQ
jgi:flagellar FliL protein